MTDIIRERVAELRARAGGEAQTAEQRIEKLERLLESLTPGGSEFSGSPENCAEWVRGRLVSVTAQVKARKEFEHWLSCLKDSICTCGRSDLNPASHLLYCPYRRKATAGEKWLGAERP